MPESLVTFERIWILVGPVLAGLFGAWLTARTQRRSDGERRRAEAEDERVRWLRDREAAAYRQAFEAIAHCRSETLQVFELARSSPSSTLIRGGVRPANEAIARLDIAHAELLLFDAGAAVHVAAVVEAVTRATQIQRGDQPREFARLWLRDKKTVDVLDAAAQESVDQLTSRWRERHLSTS